MSVLIMELDQQLVATQFLVDCEIDMAGHPMYINS